MAAGAAVSPLAEPERQRHFLSFRGGRRGGAAAYAFNGKLRGVPVRDASDLSFLRGDGLPLEARSPGSAFDRLNIYDYADG